MKRYLQRDTSSADARYQISDENGRLRYSVTGNRKPAGESIRICTPDGNTVCKIRSIGFSALSMYNINNGSECMRVNIAIGNGRAAVHFRGISFFVRGDVLLGSYSILDADTALVCSVGKDFSRGCIQLDLHQEDREIFCLAAAICIDSINVGQSPALQMS